MNLPEIGSMSHEPVEIPPAAVSFNVPYDSSERTIIFTTDELDAILRAGFQHIMSNNALSSGDFMVDMSPDQPLYIGATAIHIDPHEQTRYSNAAMDVSVVTQSATHQHRGLLLLVRNTLGQWHSTGYDTMSPLAEPTYTAIG